ncbi:Tetraacyldisaccharide 4'-kinase [Roseibacterium elongatum DSM 19469]|uniref:Tetraacyldisaccharide 4'-kinase n=1 Tax=Roseicyclus elongatus DSM 19469 TaxID=1294273 RepID=W8S3D1_9RHOB|nr:tetraacyldisaccharide 4'-kinase [Roseibacterium elongatum]AHM03276.1 Tetraacyldisaccharide 4'-kinase [Roseibacterium elongatum DSM 19469]
MRAPLFWHQAPGVVSTLLGPLGAVYAAGTRRRLARGSRARVGVPVICVGNINAGGTGKTPTAMALAMRLSARGIKAHAVTRGYGGNLEGPVQVRELSHTADETGDEALLLAAFLPTWVAKDRAAGARAAVEAGAEAIILDDGFQNAALAHDLSLVVVDAHKGFGNGRVIPAGPLREPVATGLARADLLLSIGPEGAQDRFAAEWGDNIPIPHAKGHLAALPTGLPLNGLPVLAFAGIGHPEKFFQTLKGLGADLRSVHALDDHQPLTDTLMTRMLREAKQLGAQVVTTEKDAVRLPTELRPKVMTVPVRLEVPDWAPIDAQLNRIFQT